MANKRLFNLSNIHWDIVLLIVVCPLYNAFWGKYGVFQLLLLPFVLLFLFYSIASRVRLPSKKFVGVYLAIVFQWIILTLVVGLNVVQYSKVFVLVALVFLHPISMNTKSIIYPLLTIVGLIVGFEMLQRQDMVVGVRLSLQVGETLQDPNWIAIFLFAPFCCGLRILQTGKIMSKLIGLFIISFSVYVVFLTGSRGALLGMMAALLMWIWMSFRHTKVLSGIIFTSFVLIGAYIFLNYLVPIVDIGLLDRYTSGDFGEDRMAIWTRLIPEYLNGNLLEMLFGRGPGSCVRDIGMSAHNMFLEQLFQTGLIGLILMVVFLVQIYKDTKNCNNQIGLFIIIALITHSMTTPIWGHIYFMTPLSMVIYVNNAITLEKKKSIIAV